MEHIHTPNAVFFCKLKGRVPLLESLKRTSWRDSLHQQQSTISHGHKQPQAETVGAHQWERPVSRKFKTERHKATKGRCKRQKEWAASPLSLDPAFTCLRCSRICAPRLRLKRTMTLASPAGNQPSFKSLCEHAFQNSDPNKNAWKVRFQGVHMASFLQKEDTSPAMSYDVPKAATNPFYVLNLACWKV